MIYGPQCWWIQVTSLGIFQRWMGPLNEARDWAELGQRRRTGTFCPARMARNSISWRVNRRRESGQVSALRYFSSAFATHRQTRKLPAERFRRHQENARKDLEERKLVHVSSTSAITPFLRDGELSRGGGEGGGLDYCRVKSGGRSLTHHGRGIYDSLGDLTVFHNFINWH